MEKIRRDYMENWHWCHTFQNYLDMSFDRFMSNIIDIIVGFFKFVFGIIKIPIIAIGIIIELPVRIIADIFKCGYYKKLNSQNKPKGNK